MAAAARRSRRTAARPSRGAARGARTRKFGKNDSEPGRYDIRVVTRRIEDLRTKLGIPAAVLAADVNLSRFAWYKKVGFRHTQFDIHEIGRIADRLRAPSGWPFLDYEVAAAVERGDRRRTRRRPVARGRRRGA